MIISFPDEEKNIKIKNGCKCAVFSLRIFFFFSIIFTRIFLLCSWSVFSRYFVHLKTCFVTLPFHKYQTFGAHSAWHRRRWGKERKKWFVNEFMEFFGHSVVGLFLSAIVMGAPSARARWYLTLSRVAISRRLLSIMRRMQRQERINPNCHTSHFEYYAIRWRHGTIYRRLILPHNNIINKIVRLSHWPLCELRFDRYCQWEIKQKTHSQISLLFHFYFIVLIPNRCAFLISWLNCWMKFSVILFFFIWSVLRPECRPFCGREMTWFFDWRA